MTKFFIREKWNVSTLDGLIEDNTDSPFKEIKRRDVINPIPVYAVCSDDFYDDYASIVLFYSREAAERQVILKNSNSICTYKILELEVKL